MPALYAKLGGAVFIALIYQYYYSGGDTYNYFTHTKIINSALDESIGTWWKVLTRSSPEEHMQVYKYSSQMEWYKDPASYTVAAIGAVLGLLNATTYLPIAFLFAYLSFTGTWAMYRTVVNLYPRLHKELAIAFLFIPSTIVWGSAMFKDTLCMFGVGWMTYSTFRIFINKDLSVRNILMLAASFYLIVTIKLYILLAFIPALSLWLLMTYSRKISSTGVRFLVNIVFIGATIGGFFFFTQRFANELNRYSLERIAETSEITRTWIQYSSGDEGSAYDLGKMDGTFTGMLMKFPEAVVVTLFRPWPWEVKKVIVALSAIEALLFLFFTLRVFFRRGLPLKLIFKDANVVFFLLFSLIFAFAVGISSYNFGALSRYKIPCLPFYAAFIVIALNYQKSGEVVQKVPKKMHRLPPHYTPA
jgi:hypothetical protein